MKILFGMPSPDSWGGPIACEPPFVEALRKLGNAVEEEIYVYGEKDTPTSIFTRFKRVISNALKFRKLLKQNSFDLIHLNTAFDIKTILRDSFTLFLLPRNAKVFLKLHGSEAERFTNANFVTRLFINYLANTVNGFGILSSEELENFVRLGFDRKKLFLVKNAIDLALPSDEGLGTNALIGTKLLYVSRFLSTKGLLETIRSAGILKDWGIDFALTCIGDGEIRGFAEEEVSKLNLQRYVKFTGYIPEVEVSKYLQTSSVLVFPTRHAEGFPMVLFRAAAYGLPIVTTKTRAAADYFADGVNCLFCTSSPVDVADKIVQLIENKTLRDSIGVNNIELGKDLEPEAIATDFIKIYETILKS